jgi:hypothetical protein
MAFWHAGEIDQAIALLTQVLSQHTLSSTAEQSARDDVLGTLAEFPFSKGA